VDKTLKLIDRIALAASDLNRHIDGMAVAYDDAVAEYTALGCEITMTDNLWDPNHDFLSATMTTRVDSSCRYLSDTVERLRKFDKALADLITARGQLAEEINIPLMSHLGTEPFGRYDEEYSM
jgi:hypothetical protein